MATISSRFEHDCDACTFHGRLGKYDVYRHNDSIILRFGDDGPDYRSFSADIIRQLPAEHVDFKTALAMAE